MVTLVNHNFVILSKPTSKGKDSLATYNRWKFFGFITHILKSVQNAQRRQLTYLLVEESNVGDAIGSLSDPVTCMYSTNAAGTCNCIVAHSTIIQQDGHVAVGNICSVNDFLFA